MRQLTVNPFVSEAQRAWMFANEPDMAKRWAKHTSKNKILPRRKHPVTNGRVARLDPSRTITLRRQFQADLVRRFNELRRAIVQLVLHEDAFGLKPRSALVAFHPTQIKSASGNRGTFDPKDPIITHSAITNTRWQFHSAEQKLTAFGEWIKRQIQLHIIGEHLDENAWWNRYIMDGFRRGAARAFDDTRPQVREWQDSPEAKQRLSWYNGTREEFLRSSFNWPVSREKVRLLASRTFTDLKGVTDGMAARISHTLVDGLTRGDNPRVIARELAKNVNVGKVRAQAIARTEIIRTHAEGQLDAFERLGVEEVGVMAEWLTAGDARVCEKCRSLEKIVLKVDEARGLLPRHPNCRCCWLPANVGEDESDQKRGKPAIEQAIRESYGKEDQDKSSWGGADKTISKARPVGVFNSDVMVADLDGRAREGQVGRGAPGVHRQEGRGPRHRGGGPQGGPHGVEPSQAGQARAAVQRDRRGPAGLRQAAGRRQVPPQGLPHGRRNQDCSLRDAQPADAQGREVIQAVRQGGCPAGGPTTGQHCDRGAAVIHRSVSVLTMEEGQMSDVYGESDVTFGDDSLPDWREELEEAEDPDDEELDETPPDVVAMLGFDPKEELEGE